MKVADRFSQGARAYHDLWAAVLLPHGKKLVDALPLGRMKRIVDIATGCGTLMPYIRDAAWPGAQVIGVDVAHGMVALAPPEFPVAVMDASALALATGAFDAGVMAFAIFFVPDPHQALREARRVVRRGGVFGLTSWFGEPTYPAQDIWTEEIVALGAKPSPYASVTLDPLSLRSALERAGFESVRVWSERFDHLNPPEGFLDLRTGMAQPWLSSLDDETRRGLLDRLRRRLATLPPEGFRDPTKILFATAT
jgi:SAM-dependent methyltransferase